jgi:hypothetical protein
MFMSPSTTFLSLCSKPFTHSLSVSQNFFLSSSVFSLLGPWALTMMHYSLKHFRGTHTIHYDTILHSLTMLHIPSRSMITTPSVARHLAPSLSYHELTTSLQICVTQDTNIEYFFQFSFSQIRSCLSTCPQPRTFIQETVQSPTCDSGDCL